MIDRRSRTSVSRSHMLVGALIVLSAGHAQNRPGAVDDTMQERSAVLRLSSGLRCNTYAAVTMYDGPETWRGCCLQPGRPTHNVATLSEKVVHSPSAGFRSRPRTSARFHTVPNHLARGVLARNRRCTECRESAPSQWLVMRSNLFRTEESVLTDPCSLYKADQRARGSNVKSRHCSLPG